MLFKTINLNRIICDIRSAAGDKFYGWNAPHTDIIKLWKNSQPIPFKDDTGLNYLYYPLQKKYALDKKLSKEDMEWIIRELPKIQSAAIEAAANNCCSLIIDADGIIKGSDERVIITNHFFEILKQDCGIDCRVIKNKDNSITLSWDD